MPMPVGFPHVDDFLGRLNLIPARRPKLQMLFKQQVVVAGEDDADPLIRCDLHEMVWLFVGSEWPGQVANARPWIVVTHGVAPSSTGVVHGYGGGRDALQRPGTSRQTL